MSEGLYPKEDGQIYYGKDANMSYYQGALSINGNYESKSITSTSVTQIVAANGDRRKILIRNIGAENVYLGDSTVDTEALVLGPNLNIVLNVKTSIHGITETGSSEIRYFEVV